MRNINKIACDIQANGWCDQLSKHPKNYLFVLLLSLIMNYLVPLLAFLLVLLVVNNNDIGDYLFYFFSPIFPGVVSIYFGITSIGILVIGTSIVVADVFYFVYVVRQLGIYVIIPIMVEAAKWVILLFFEEFILVAAILSLIPFVSVAIAAHFYEKIREDGGLITRNV